MINILHEKALVLKEMVTFELEDHPLNPKLTCKPYPHMFELQTLIFKLLLEVKEAIEIFSTKHFFGSKDLALALCDRLRLNREKNVEIWEKYSK